MKPVLSSVGVGVVTALIVWFHFQHTADRLAEIVGYPVALFVAPVVCYSVLWFAFYKLALGSPKVEPLVGWLAAVLLGAAITYVPILILAVAWGQSDG